MISGSDIFQYKKNVRLAVVGVISYVIYVDAFSVFLNIEENLLENKKYMQMCYDFIIVKINCY